LKMGLIDPGTQQPARRWQPSLARLPAAWAPGIAQTHHNRQDTLVKRASHREQSYSDVISESAKLPFEPQCAPGSRHLGQIIAYFNKPT
jgi:hypothetical protein